MEVLLILAFIFYIMAGIGNVNSPPSQRMTKKEKKRYTYDELQEMDKRYYEDLP